MCVRIAEDWWLLVSLHTHHWAISSSFVHVNAQALAATVAAQAVSLEPEAVQAPVATEAREHLWLPVQGQVQTTPCP